MTKRILQREEMKISSIDEVLQNLKGKKDYMKDYFMGYNKRPGKNLFDELGVEELK